MLYETGRRLLKDYDEDDSYTRAFNQQFTNFPSDVGFNRGLSAPQPDFVEGLGKKAFKPFPVGSHIDGAVLFKDSPSSVTLPHLAGEWKGPGQDMKKAELQSGYDGAALVYGRNKALAYVGTPDSPGYAEVTTFATDGTVLNMYAHYSTPAEDGTLKYHQYPVNSTILTGFEGHKEGRKWIRNQQDYARAQSYSLKDQLTEHWEGHRDDPDPLKGTALPPMFTDSTALNDGKV